MTTFYYENASYRQQNSHCVWRYRYTSSLRQVEKNRTEIFGFEISLVGILCTSPGFHIRSYLLQLSTPQLHYLYTLAGLTRVFSHEKTAHEVQMKMSGLVGIREVIVYVFNSTKKKKKRKKIMGLMNLCWCG